MMRVRGPWHWRQIARTDPNEAEAYHFLGRAAYLQNDMERALDYFERCTAMDSDDYESPLLALGIIRDSHPIEEIHRLASIGVWSRFGRIPDIGH